VPPACSAATGCPSILRPAGVRRRPSLPGFNPVEAYEAAIANVAPELECRPKPESVEELLEWAAEPLATAEVVLIMQIDVVDVRAELARVAHAEAAGADLYWVADGAASQPLTAVLEAEPAAGAV
jgi:hypothetical protein